MKARNFLIVILIIIFFIFYTTNSPSVYTIDDSAYVIAIGVDSGDNGKIKLSLQIAKPSSESISSSSQSNSSQSESSIINTIECDTIYSGVNSINSYISNKLNLSYCKVVVFSEEVASKGILSYVCTLINDVDVRPYCNILISKCEAKYYLENSKPLLDDISSKYYDTQEVSEKNTALTKKITLLDFYNDYYDTFGEPSAILGNINGVNSELTTNSNNENKNIENLGLAVFHNGNFVGEISGEETIYNMIVTNSFKNSIISIPSPFGDSKYIALSISNVKSKNTVKIVNGFPYIICDIDLEARVLSTSPSSNYLSEDNKLEIEQYANSYLKSNLYNYLYKTSIVLKSDINKFGKEAVKNFTTWDEWISYDWINNYCNSIFSVNVNTNVKSSYLVIGIS